MTGEGLGIKSSNRSWMVLAFFAGIILTAAIGMFWPNKKEKYRIYTLQEEKSYCLNEDKRVCIVLPKGTRVYSRAVEGPSHDMGNELVIPLLLPGTEIEKSYQKGGVAEWPAPPYIEK